MDKSRTKLTETTLITPTSIYTNETKQGVYNRIYISFEATVLKLIFRYCSSLAAGLCQVT